MSSNRFLNGSDGGLTLADLQDGSLSLYLNRLKTQGIIEANDYESKTTFSMNDEIQKIDNFTASTLNNTNITGKLRVSNEMMVPIIKDPTELTRIELDDTDINIISQNFTFNGSDVPTDADYQILKNKTFYMDPNLSIGSTTFEGGVYSDGFIIQGGPSPAGYLMSDGTILTSSSTNNNSNIYLYNNNLTITAPPSAGQIRFNNEVIANATIVYISHLTRDGVDIDPFLALISQLSILYIQDQDNSLNFCKFNVNATPSITPNSYVSVNVSYLEGGGTGATNFPAGMNIFLSIFSNDVEIDSRISNIETKTQLITANSTRTTFTQSVQFTLSGLNTFQISYQDETFTAFPRFFVGENQISSFKPMSMNNQKLSGIPTPTNNDDAVNKLYVDTNDTVLQTSLTTTNNNVATLQTKTQNITANLQNTIFEKSILQRLGLTDALRVVSSVGETNILDVSRDIINAFKPLNMQTQSISNVSTVSTGTVIFTSAPSISFVKSNGTFDNSVYALQSSLTTTNNNVSNKLSIDGSIAMTGTLNMGNLNIINLEDPNVDTDATNKGYVDFNDALKLDLTGGTLTGSITATSLIKTGGLSKDFLKADGSITTMQGITEAMLNKVYYNPTGDILSFSINMDNWRFQSWGYLALSTLSVVDCPTGLMTNIGGSLSNVGINPPEAPKGYKIRTTSNPPNTSNGATCGWIGTALLNYIIPMAGWYVKIGFSLDATTGTGTNRTMVGLFQSTARPVLDNTTTIASITTGSMGIVQEKGETVWSFNTRGPSGSIKIPTTISCETATKNWYTLEMINDPYSTSIVLILSCQTASNTTQVESTQFSCGLANTMPLATSFIHLQQSMASPGGVNSSALVSLGNIIIKLSQ